MGIYKANTFFTYLKNEVYFCFDQRNVCGNQFIYYLSCKNQ